MKRPVVVFCWFLVLVATTIVVLDCINLVTRPAIGFDYARATGTVANVVPGSPADRAGLRDGDHVISLAGYGVGKHMIPLFFVRAGSAVTVVFERDGMRRSVDLLPVELEQVRREALSEGTERVLWSITGYLTFILNFWMLGLGVALLVLRPENKDARLSALALMSWSGGTFLFQSAGFGALVAGVPYALRVAIYLADAFFISLFFGALLHFALVFPSVKDAKRRWFEVLPYLVAWPIFVETAANGMQRANGSVSPARLPLSDIYDTLAPLLLIAALVILAVRLVRASEVNARRRLKLLFLALLPGTLSFVYGSIVDRLGMGYTWVQFGRIFDTIGVVAGSAIYVYAVVRHRMFNIRVLVRRSIQYVLARSTLIALMSLPLVGLAGYLWMHRRDSLAQLLTGTPAVYVLIILPLVLVIHYRKRLLESLDRRFFREQYDARQLLLHVVSMIRGGSDMLTLSRAALDEVDRALHPQHIALWHLDIDGSAMIRGFVSGNVPEESPLLAADSTLASLLSTSDDPLDVHSRQTRALIRRLPEAERIWLRDVDAHLLVPLLMDTRLVGVMVLGERKSEEPYGSEDRELLRTLAAQLALTIDYSRLKQSPSLVWGNSPASHGAVHLHISDAMRLCPVCGRCYEADDEMCEFDQTPLVSESGVPRIIEEKYIVTKLLGRGGMGSVYLANQKRLNRPVAIKVLLAHLVGSSSMRTRFEREARIVARLRHPAIVTIHDFGLLHSGHAYLVMEYLDGQTLRKMIQNGPQTVEQVLDMLKPVAEAIDTAHRAGVIHRDLKPENIMIVRDPQAQRAMPRVLDFGLAKMTGPVGDDEATLVQSGPSGGLVGTLMYMAPEVLSGKVADARADQYSLALIAYELLAGEHPLAGATDLASVVRGHTEGTFVSIRERIADVPASVEQALQRAMARDANARFGSVSEFVASW
ncbi:MAG TPA: protein kinase [Thermoanaerobaculia bacterium]|nr:protein kinase [Thermoanaerobaculia bacterium]